MINTNGVKPLTQASKPPAAPAGQESQRRQAAIAAGCRTAMPHATRRECADSSSTVRRRYFAGAQRGGLDIAELEWPPGDAETEWLVRWRSAAQLARASMPVIITYVLLAEGWVPWTVATESALIPAWWGLWAARSLAGGDIIARMLDGALCGLFTSDRDPALAATRVRQGGGELYLLAQYGGDGTTRRSGQPAWRAAVRKRYARAARTADRRSPRRQRAGGTPVRRGATD